MILSQYQYQDGGVLEDDDVPKSMRRPTQQGVNETRRERVSTGFSIIGRRWRAFKFHFSLVRLQLKMVQGSPEVAESMTQPVMFLVVRFLMEDVKGHKVHARL